MENSLPRVDDLLRDQEFNNGIAILDENGHLRYSQLYRGMQNIAATLLTYRIISNERVIVHMGNRPDAITTIMGISYSGNTFVPVAHAVKPQRLTDIINDCEAVAIFTDTDHVDILDKLGDVPSLRIAINVDELEDLGVETIRSKPAYPAALMYTSGTTGKPKGVICPHHKMMAAVTSINAYLFHNKNDIIATGLPISHGYGLYQYLTAFAAGSAILNLGSIAIVERTLELIKKWKASGFATVPSFVQMIMTVDGWEDYLSGLEYLTTAGAALPPSTFSTLIDALPNTSIIPMYGQTEVVRALYYPSARQTVRLNSCGVAIPDTTTVLVDKDDDDVGELVIESPHVMDGYWKNTEATAETFRNGRLHTGDLFCIDEDGMHYYVGRKDDLVKIKGERCSPQELDNALIAMEGIVEAASFSISDLLWGNRFVAFVVGDVDAKEVMRYCRRELEPYLLPKDVMIVKKIPKNDNGKISRKILKEFYLVGEKT